MPQLLLPLLGYSTWGVGLAWGLGHRAGTLATGVCVSGIHTSPSEPSRSLSSCQAPSPLATDWAPTYTRPETTPR